MAHNPALAFAERARRNKLPLQPDHTYPPVDPDPVNRSSHYRPLRWSKGRHPMSWARVSQNRGGWYRGQALIDGVVIYDGPPTRDRAVAWTYAQDMLQLVKAGMEWERQHG